MTAQPVLRRQLAAWVYGALLVVVADAADGPGAGSPRWRVSRATNAMATATHAAMATQSMNRLSGSMNVSRAALPNTSVATLYIPSGKTTLHSVGS